MVVPYCTVADVRRYVHTSLSDSDIEYEIAISDSLIDRRLGTQSSSDKVITKLSALLTARSIKMRQPTTIAIGEYSEAHGDVIKAMKADIEEIFTLYETSGGLIFRGSQYRYIDEDTRFPEDP